MRTKAKQVPIEKLDANTYEVPKGEEKYYHARIEVKKFDSNTGERQSIPRIQKFGSKGFKTIQKNLKKQGYTVDVLHDPTKWLADKNQAAEQTAIQRAESKKKAAEQKAADERQALKDALKAEILAEINAENKQSAKKTDKDTEANAPKSEKVTEAKK